MFSSQLVILCERRKGQATAIMVNGRELTVSAAPCWGSGIRDIVCVCVCVYPGVHTRTCALRATHRMYRINLYVSSIALSTTLKPSHYPCNRAIIMFSLYQCVKHRKQKFSNLAQVPQAKTL